MIASVVSFFVSQPIMARESLDVSISDSGVLVAVVGGGVYIAGAALIGLVVGTIIRNTAVTLVAVTTIFFLGTIISFVQPDSWATVTQFLPHAAGLALMSSSPQPELLSPLAALLVLAGWIAAGLSTAGLLIQRRDTE